MTEFHRMDLQQSNPKTYFLVFVVPIAVLFIHALLQYSDGIWISDPTSMNIGRQILQNKQQQQQQQQQQQKAHSNYNKDEQERTIVVYTGPTSLDRSTGKNELYLRNFDYFLAHKGVDCSSQHHRHHHHHDTIITLSEETYHHYTTQNQQFQHLMNECGPKALRVVQRQDTCYDLGSIHLVLNDADNFDLTPYDYFVYLNCGVVGPLWWSSDLPWTTFFTSLLNDRVKMSGLSANCRHRDGFSAHLQSMAFALDPRGLEIVRNSGAIYDCMKGNDAMTMTDKMDLIGRYELGMSRAIFEQGYSISSWLWSLGRNSNSVSHGTGQRQVHEPVVMHDPNHKCRDVWYVDPFLRISSNYPRRSPSWNMTFFKTSRFIPPDILEEVGYELTNKPMKDLVGDYSKAVASRFWAFQMVQSVFVE
ncbi:unnamed protein product [Cylindrotheca closterium]|uniref:Uncharacterized protein n=1 Tax=Cylindrotheca closterium TaxID=2856 RepID=A0AAD2FS21_9STRA|nr:unnamed protein product [Cylindrotheca closterium]